MTQTKKLMVKAKAMYHVGDLELTIRRGEVVQLSEVDANRSNDLWRGQQFGLLEVKWVYEGQVVPVPKAKTVVVSSKDQIARAVPTNPVAPLVAAPATQDDVHGLRQEIASLRKDLNDLTAKSNQASAELKAEIARLEAKLPKPEEAKKPLRVKEAKEPSDAGLE